MSNPIKPTFKTELLPALLVLAAVISSFYFYSHFPEQVPIHWNVKGEVDNYGSRAFGAFFFPGIIIGMYFLFLAIPYLDPKKDRYQQFRKVYHIFKTILVGFMVVIYFLSSLSSLGYQIPINVWMPILVGILFIILGNYMAKIKPNWFMGIRTPWTLSSEEVWNKTHRLGGKAFIAGGLIMAVLGFTPASFFMPLFITLMVIVVIVPIIYSFIIFKKE
jgi:uncharacterized membrane protein